MGPPVIRVSRTARRVFRDNVVVLTGASYGIGREMALQLSALGARLVLAARSENRLYEVADACRGRSGNIPLVVATDVSREADCRSLIKNAVESHGRLDTLILNAGISMDAAFEDISDSVHFNRILETNVLGAMYCTRHALPHLKNSRGRVVVMSSLAGKTGVPGYSIYSASKHALVGFFDSVRIETAGSGMSLSIMLPDFVASGIHERELDATGHPVGKGHYVDYSRVMDVSTCASIVIDAAAKRKREVIMSWRGRIGQWIKLIAPGVVDSIARRAKGL